MEISFLNPAALAGMLALAIPVVIHLLRRRETVRVVFPAARLLASSATVLTRSRRLAEILLLAVRTAIIFALVACFARPFLKSGLLAPRESPRAAVALVIDDSPGMGYCPGDRSLLDDAKAAGAEMLGSLGEPGEVAVLTGSGRLVFPLGPAAEAARALARVGISDSAGDIPAAVASASEILSRSELERREIVVLSDLGRESFPGVESVGELARPALGAGLSVLSVAPEQPANAGVIDVAVSAPRLYAGIPAELVVTVRATGEGRPARRTLVVSGEGVGEQRREITPLAAGASVQTRCTIVPEKPGWLPLTARLEPPDALAADDLAFLALAVCEPPPVAVLASSPLGPAGGARSALYVKAALQPWGERDERFFRVRTISPGELAEAEPGAFALVIIPPECALEHGDWGRVRRMLSGGAGALVLAGDWCLDAPRRTAAAPVLGAFAARECRPPEGAGLLVSAPEELRLAFDGGRNGRIASARFERCVDLTFGEGGPVPAARGAGGETLMWCGGAGRGRRLVFAFEPSPGWTDLVRHPSWVPLIHESAAYLARMPRAECSCRVGRFARFDLALDAGRSHEGSWTFGPLGGEVMARGDLADIGESGGVALGPVVARGFHELLVSGGAPRRLVAANIDPREGAMERLAPGGKGAGLIRRSGREVASELKQARRGREASGQAAILVAALAAAELALMAAFGIRRGGSGASQEEPGREGGAR